MAPIAGDALLACGMERPVLKAALLENAKRHLLLLGELRRLMGALAAEGMAVISVKGPALAEAIYRDPAHRYSGDLDLLVRPEDFGRAAAVLEREGYAEPGDKGIRRARRAFRRWNYEAVFESSARGIAVDLHWDLMPRGFPVQFDMRGIWARAGAGRLAPEDEMRFLCAHAAKHEDKMLSRELDIELLGSRVDVGRVSGWRWKLRLALTPTEADWESLPGLPAALFLLYVPWRVLRLVKTRLGQHNGAVAGRVRATGEDGAGGASALGLRGQKVEIGRAGETADHVVDHDPAGA